MTRFPAPAQPNRPATAEGEGSGASGREPQSTEPPHFKGGACDRNLCVLW